MIYIVPRFVTTTLDNENSRALIDAYIFNGPDPLRDEVLNALATDPVPEKHERLGQNYFKMKEYVEICMNEW